MFTNSCDTKTSDEMEMLLLIYNTNKVLFHDIIEEKIRKEVAHLNEGKSFAQLFEKNGVKDNSYIAQNQFQKHLDHLKRDSLQHAKRAGTN